MLKSVGGALALLILGGIVSAQAAADPVADFYRGKTVTLVVSSSTGGGYDTTARAVARYLGKHIPGAPTVVIQNMPGGGGIAGTNYLYNVARKDGTVIGAVQNNTPFEPLLGTTEAKYDPLKFNWLGSPSVEVGLLVVWYKTPVNTINDLKTHEITVGSSGANSTPSFYARLINATLHTKIKIIVGYPGQTEAFLAIERGEIDGYPSLFYNTLSATKPTWLKDKKLKLLLQYGLTKEPEIPDVPSLMDLVTNPDDKALLQASLAEVTLGRPYLMPPGVSADRVAAMRKAFMDTLADPAFLGEAKKMALGVNAPRNSAQVLQLIAQAYSAPPKVIARLKGLMYHD